MAGGLPLRTEAIPTSEYEPKRVLSELKRSHTDAFTFDNPDY
jgi:hypothetical protein